MTRPARCSRRTVLSLSTLLFAGCGLLGPGHREFVIQVDSIAGPTSVPANAAFQQFFYGGVGPDGCHRFKEFKVSRSSTTADITVIGEESRGGGDCTTLVVYMRGEPLTFDPPISDPFTLRVHQRDGSVLTKIIRPD
jgi:hypothetical protein